MFPASPLLCLMVGSFQVSDWSTIDAAANAVMQQTFGEPVVYQPLQAGAAVGEPLTITAVRHARVLEESGAMGNFEEISVNPTDFQNPPGKGRLGDRVGGRSTS